ncbi:MAG: hypothetical protein ACI8W7_000700, partial [Gammaproteobacteria bacterium]
NQLHQLGREQSIAIVDRLAAVAVCFPDSRRASPKRAD